MHKKLEKAYALSDARIQFVSLVDKAANKRQFLITKAEGSSVSFQSYGRIVKADSESHFVTGIVYEPMAEDTDGECLFFLFFSELKVLSSPKYYDRNALGATSKNGRRLVLQQRDCDPLIT